MQIIIADQRSPIQKPSKSKKGRHPVIGGQVGTPGESNMCQNDIYLDNDTQQIIIITGPIWRESQPLLGRTALIVLMAQMGSSRAPPFASNWNN